MNHPLYILIITSIKNIEGKKVGMAVKNKQKKKKSYQTRVVVMEN